MCNFAVKPYIRLVMGAMLLLCVTTACQQQPVTNTNTSSNSTHRIQYGQHVERQHRDHHDRYHHHDTGTRTVQRDRHAESGSDG